MATQKLSPSDAASLISEVISRLDNLSEAIRSPSPLTELGSDDYDGVASDYAIEAPIALDRISSGLKRAVTSGYPGDGESHHLVSAEIDSMVSYADWIEGLDEIGMQDAILVLRDMEEDAVYKAEVQSAYSRLRGLPSAAPSSVGQPEAIISPSANRMR